MCELLIFGGTTEGRELAQFCCESGISTAVSVATEYGGGLLPQHKDIHVFTGRLDNAEMAVLIKRIDCRAVIDATHPYATEVTENIKLACAETGTPYHRLLRSNMSLEGCIGAADMNEVTELLSRCGGNILSTLGSKELPKLTAVKDFRERVWARVLPAENIVGFCTSLGFAAEHIIAEKGPFTVEQNIEHIKLSGAEMLLTKESGAAGGFPEKLKAAGICGIRAIVLMRPQEEGSTMEEIKALVCGMRR